MDLAGKAIASLQLRALLAMAILPMLAGVAAALAQEGAIDGERVSGRALDASEPISYFIAAGAPGSGYRDGDRELAEWALHAWARASGATLEFIPGPEATSLLRIYFVAPGFGQYGEARALDINGRRGAAVYIRPETDALGRVISVRSRGDALFRDSIVYMTCVHEIGHALGLVHTDVFDDIMYFFGFGGDIPRYFGRFRELLKSRADIAATRAISAGDLAQLRALYGLAAGATGN